MLKTYISLNYLHLTTTVFIGEMPVIIEFIGGRTTPQRVNGRFSTDSVQLQKAIEKDSGYEKEFKLVVKAPSVQKETDVKSEVKKVEIKGVKNRQMAIEWVKKNLNIELQKELTISDIKKFVTNRGFIFCDWR